MQNTSVLELKAAELLQAVQPKQDRFSKDLKAFVQDVKESINRLPSHGPISFSSAKKELRKLNVSFPVPFPLENTEADISLRYEKPTSISLSAQAAISAVVKERGTYLVDLAVKMPSEIFHKKDYLNFKGFYKRAYYLAHLAGMISKDPKLEINTSFDYKNGYIFQPILVIAPKSGKGSRPRTQLRLCLEFPSDLFEAQKLLPWKPCIRRHTTSGEGESLQEVDPTPVYNGAFLSDCLIASYDALLKEAVYINEHVKQSCSLFSIWLHQRGFGSSIQRGGFGGFEAAAMIALLLQCGGSMNKPLFPSGYNACQLFKSLLRFLTTTDLVREPFVSSQEIPPELEATERNGPIFLDRERKHNILWKMDSQSFQRAEITLRALAHPSFDGFTPTFVTRVDEQAQKFDVLLMLDAPAPSIGSTYDLALYQQEACGVVWSLLSQGLGERARLINVSSEDYSAWALNTKCPTLTANRLTIGVVLDPVNSKKTVDHGPPAEEKEKAAAFRAFWGTKAELRRFQDGSIIESAVWSSDERDASVTVQVISHLVSLHIGEEFAETISVISDGTLKPSNLGSLIAENPPWDAAWKEFEKLQNDIRSLEDQPLSVRQISPSCADLRFSSIYGPRSSRELDIILQFEGSARWPDDLEAIQRTKAALLLKLGESLEDSKANYTSSVGLENEADPYLNAVYLDVSFARFVFRIRVYHERELQFLENQIHYKMDSPFGLEKVAMALRSHRLMYRHRPAHTQLIRRLCLMHPCLSTTIRLLKKWLSSHLLSSHISDETVELVAVRVFTYPYPFVTPGSVQTAFLRCLSLLSKWDWHHDPLIIEFTEPVSEADFRDFTKNFENWRKIDPGCNRRALAVHSELDREGLLWTDEKPAKVVAARMTMLARAACKDLEEQEERMSGPLDFQKLFSPSLAGFDFLIYCDTEGRQADGYHVQGDLIEACEAFFKELQGLYGSSILFFNGLDSSLLIAGVWNPAAAPRAWKTTMGYSHMPGTGPDGQPQISINKTAILNEIARLGRGLVFKIE